ncbi:hypothetical protein R3P38DRAFT_2811348 [Favolaschia claudopus]|uniref:Uncharacterized protein n=1 Tax=Favolaschia claudopus TaxID=2862362 RepID=A0AAV9Z9F4_9AGAR
MRVASLRQGTRASQRDDNTKTELWRPIHAELPIDLVRYEIAHSRNRGDCEGIWPTSNRRRQSDAGKVGHLLSSIGGITEEESHIGDVTRLRLFLVPSFMAEDADASPYHRIRDREMRRSAGEIRRSLNLPSPPPQPPYVRRDPQGVRPVYLDADGEILPMYRDIPLERLRRGPWRPSATAPQDAAPPPDAAPQNEPNAPPPFKGYRVPRRHPLTELSLYNDDARPPILACPKPHHVSTNHRINMHLRSPDPIAGSIPVFNSLLEVLTSISENSKKSTYGGDMSNYTTALLQLLEVGDVKLPPNPVPLDLQAVVAKT